MNPVATPEVGDDGLELVTGPGISFAEIDVDALGVQEITQDDDQDEAEDTDQPVAKPEPPPTSRRSKEGAPSQPGVNLDDLPEFRNWKSKMDRELQAERNRNAEIQRQFEAQAQAQQMAALEAQLGNVYNQDEQRQVIEQMARLRTQQELSAWQQWEQYVNQRVQAEGLDPADFKPRSYQGDTGAAQFEADLHTKARKKLADENAALRKKTENIDAEVRRQVAQALASQGFDAVDTGTPGGPHGGSDDDWKRDMRLFNSGKMSREAFRKRWGSA